MTALSSFIDTIKWVSQQGWTPATGGNFSVRANEGYWVTASGRDKRQLSVDDLLLCDLHGAVLEGKGSPSAESELHAALYRKDSNIGCILHTHTVASTVLSRRYPEGVVFSGFEMQKALAGVTTHDTTITLPVVPNSQTMQDIAQAVALKWPMPWGFLVAGHGLYALGADVFACRRHLEGLEFLMACVLEEARWPQ